MSARSPKELSEFCELAEFPECQASHWPSSVLRHSTFLGSSGALVVSVARELEDAFPPSDLSYNPIPLRNPGTKRTEEPASQSRRQVCELLERPNESLHHYVRGRLSLCLRPVNHARSGNRSAFRLA